MSKYDLCCKVGKQINEYDLSTLDAELRERRQEGASLRDLAAFANRKILDSALSEVTTPVGLEVDTLYPLLAESNSSTGRRGEVRSQLSRAGIDMAALESDLVSHETIREHLRSCLDMDTSRDPRIDIEKARGTIEWARSQSEGIIQNTLTRLVNAGEISGSELEVIQSTRVSCEKCGRSYRVHEFLDTSGCACEQRNE